MYNFLTKLTKLARDKKGVTALEYGLIAALIGAVIAGSVGNVGTQVKSVFDSLNTKMTTAATSAAK